MDLRPSMRHVPGNGKGARPGSHGPGSASHDGAAIRPGRASESRTWEGRTDMAQGGNPNRRTALVAAGEVVGGWGPAPLELDDRSGATLRMADW